MGLGLSLVILLVASPASAYLRSTITGEPEKGLPIAWPTRTVVILTNTNGTSKIDDKEGTYEAIRRSLQTWGAVSCADFTLVDGGLTDLPIAETKPTNGTPDMKNVITFRSVDWPHQKSLLALTTIIFDKTNGDIVDADMELNAVHFEFSVSETQVLIDVQNTVTHELGHVLGLDHPCLKRDPTSGESVCVSSPEIKEATMYQNAPTGETKKRDLHQDDVDGICAIYPPIPVDGADASGTDTGTPKSGGCQAVGTPWIPTGLLLAFLGMVGVFRRRSNFPEEH